MAATSWGLDAKNSMQMFGGYSSYQLTLGKNPVLPNIMNDKLPAMEDPSASRVLEENLRAMRSARENFVKVENSRKIKRALKSQVRSCNDLRVFPGENVLYKRNNPDKWHGPGKVIGQEGQCVTIKHGFQIVRVHPCHIQKCHQKVTNQEALSPTTLAPVRKQDNYLEVRDENENTAVDVPTESTENVEAEDVSPISDIESKGIPKPRTYVKYVPREEESAENSTWRRAYILSRGGKAHGKYPNHLNVQLDEEDQPRCVDWTELASNFSFSSKWTLDNDPEEEHEILLSSTEVFDQEVVDAKLLELEKFHTNGVYEEVVDEGQSTIGVRWVITKKKPSGAAKARLVALGYQENSTNIRKDSPTCHRDSIRIVLMLVAAKGWEVEHIDVQSAFLQGKEITRKIYIKPPQEAHASGLWRLKKCIYGLVDGPRNWYIELRDTLVSQGMTVSTLDDSFLFKKWGDGDISGIMVLHVDDLMLSGEKDFREGLGKTLKNKFRLSNDVKRTFVYTGLNIKQHGLAFISMSQAGYIDQIQPIQIDPTRSRNNSWEINDTERSQLRSACGQLLWAATQTRPDVSYAACIAGNAFTNGTVADLKLVNKTIKYMKANPFPLRYTKVQLHMSMIVVFCDASFGNLKDGSSQGGHIVFITSKDGNSCPLTWRSKKIRRVCKSTLGAESWAMVEALESAELFIIYFVLYLIKHLLVFI